MDDLFGLIVIIIGIAAGIYSDKKKKEGKQKKAAVPNQPGFLWWSCRKTGCSGGCGKCDAEGFICKTAGIKTEAAAEVWHGCIEYGKAHAGSASCFKSRKRYYFKPRRFERQ